LAQLCQESWRISITADARIDRIHAKVDQYLAAIEAAGLREFWYTNDHPSVERIFRDLRVVSGQATTGIGPPPMICLALPGTSGAIGVSSVLDAVESEARKRDNIRKLGSAYCSERHLAVYLNMLSHPWMALVDFEPPTALPILPQEITHVWAY